ncbi:MULTISPECIES: hypothetical protein [Flavobacterium]|uniref:hypothetical protein n=1 Tax=Flavobacterium TaxID=237 RepID=UPI0011840265|nr:MULTISPECIES: hypothetical protein [Flavobacterium]MCR4031530.1 hypothetical protein [Flavobacterium panacis]
MKLLAILLFITSLSSAQIQDYEFIKKNLLNDIIRQEAFNKRETFVVTKIDSVNVEHLLKLMLEKPYITNSDFQNKDLILTGEELQYLSKRLREQYQDEWKEEDFSNRKLIHKSDILACLDKDMSNQVIMISNPIYIKTDNTAFIYLANLCCCTGYGSSSLALYSMKDGVWKKSFEIVEDNY